MFAFFNESAEGSRWYYSVYTKPHELNGLKETVGLSMCQHSNPITLVSTIISNISLSLKYSKGELKCLFSSDEPYDSEQRKDLEIEYLKKWRSVANYSGFVQSCINLFIFSVKQIHIEPYFLRPWSSNLPLFSSCLKPSSFQVCLMPMK